MKVFVLQNVIVMGRHTNFVIVIKRMQRNIENEVINENEGRPIQRGNYERKSRENRSWQNNAVSNSSITKTKFSATSAILKKTALLSEVAKRRKNIVPMVHNLPEIVISEFDILNSLKCRIFDVH